MFLATGCADATVLPANSARLAAAQRAAGGIVVEQSYPRLGHVLTIGAFAGVLGFVAPALEETMAFLADPGATPPPPRPCPVATG